MEDNEKIKIKANIKKLRAIDPVLPRDFMNFYGTYSSSTIEDYEKSFERVLKGENFVRFLQARKEPITVIDLMSPTDVLASLFAQLPEKHKKGLAVGMSDMRSFSKENKGQRDADLNIDYISNTPSNKDLGDISQNITWQEIDRWLAGQKADLIVERAEAGLFSVPHMDLFYRTFIQRIWDRLDDNGGMFVGQTLPAEQFKSFGINLLEWVQNAKQEGIDVDYQEGTVPWQSGRKVQLAGALRIVKHPGSPNLLPHFPVQGA